jgi:L-rhamnose mutarotase
VWPAVVAQIRQSNITDYSIAYDRESSLLFASFKYTGRDWDGDMAAMRAHEPTRRWWAMTDGFQESVNPGAVSSERGGTVGEDGRKVPGWWKECEEVFYLP